MKLLLVDDEPGIREGLAALLRRRGHEVLTAGDCRRAGELLDAGDIDLVLTDWRLPDGRASGFIARSDCPVVAMSGHPEEVEGHLAVSCVLTKPVSPSQLLDAIAGLEAVDAPASSPALPRDVAALVAAARAVLGEPASVEDDGTFVTLRAPLPGEEAIARLEELGGDLRVLAPGGEPVAALRWYRDGRPDAGVPVVRPDGRWPEVAEFAVDFDMAGLSTADFAACLDRAAGQRRQGRRVHFLNVPDPLVSWATDQGRSDDMPMRAAVGPRLPSVLTDLWSRT